MFDGIAVCFGPSMIEWCFAEEGLCLAIVVTVNSAPGERERVGLRWTIRATKQSACRRPWPSRDCSADPPPRTTNFSTEG